MIIGIGIAIGIEFMPIPIPIPIVIQQASRNNHAITRGGDTRAIAWLNFIDMSC